MMSYQSDGLANMTPIVSNLKSQVNVASICPRSGLNCCSIMMLDSNNHVLCQSLPLNMSHHTSVASPEQSSIFRMCLVGPIWSLRCESCPEKMWSELSRSSPTQQTWCTKIVCPTTSELARKLFCPMNAKTELSLFDSCQSWLPQFQICNYLGKIWFKRAAILQLKLHNLVLYNCDATVKCHAEGTTKRHMLTRF